MRESVWRSQLIRSYREAWPDHYIRTVESRFIAGFPDIYRVRSGKSAHFELKIGRVAKSRILDYFTKIQVAECRKLAKAGVDVFGLVKWENFWPVESQSGEKCYASLLHFKCMRYTSLTKETFKEWWLNPEGFSHLVRPYPPE